MKLKEYTPVIAIIFLVFIFMSLYYLGDDLGFTDIDTDFLEVLPGLALFVIGAILLATTQGAFALPALSLVGIGLAWLFGTLDGMDMISDELKAGLTIGEIQLWIIIIFVIAGGIATAFRKT